jgi:catechol 2,3-dioxygenase-like lactoylglutathione lyase family enzyme
MIERMSHVPDSARVQVRVARPTRDLDAAVAFYRDAVGLPVLDTFADHDGFSGVIFGIPDATRQLELVAHAGVQPSPTSEDQLVFYLGSADAVARCSGRLSAAGFEPAAPSNPYWASDGAACFVDPDGYWLIVSPASWLRDDGAVHDE